MRWLNQFLRHPQQLWLRRANFQIHLWAGVILAIYVAVIGVTGSVLVFGAELDRLVNPDPWAKITLTRPIADVDQVIGNLLTAYPHTHAISLMTPTPSVPVFVAVLQTRGRLSVAFDSSTGKVIGEVPRQQSKLEWIYDLHENLFARRTGRVINGLAAGVLAMLALTGLVNWWPGIQSWRRALTVDFRRSWKRVNFDLHSAAGFWSLTLILMWALTGIYFAWPGRALEVLNRFSPIVNSRPPVVNVDPGTEREPLDFHAMVEQAHFLDPGAQWKGLIFPSSRRSPFQVLMSRAPGVGRDYEDTLFFNPYNGKFISIWRYGDNKSLGDWIIWLQIPLHFGTHWGLGIKCLWALIGLALPLLSITGLLMYWNRVLSKKWSRFIAK